MLFHLLVPILHVSKLDQREMKVLNKLTILNLMQRLQLIYDVICFSCAIVTYVMYHMTVPNLNSALTTPLA